MTGKLEKLWATKNKNDEWWSSFVTSPIAILINYFAIEYTWVTPNRVTLVSFLVAILAAVCIVSGGTVNFVIAAFLIHLSHVFDCMDGQIARYRQVSSAIGSYCDRLTDQMQVILWFGAVGYAAYAQTSSVQPLFLVFIGVTFYGLRSYAKYVAIEIEMSRDPTYQNKMADKQQSTDTAGLGFSFVTNAVWFLKEQHKILRFDEGVFIFMLSAALLLDALVPMLWVFSISQLFLGVYRVIQHGRGISQNIKSSIQK